MIQLSPRRARGKHTFVNKGSGHSILQRFSNQVRLCLVKPSGTPDRYDAIVNDELIVISSRTPFTDAARVLVERGCDTNSILILRHFGSDANCLIAKIGIAAKLTVKEPDRGRAHFARYVPLLSSPVAPPMRNFDPTQVAVSNAGAAR